MGTKSRRLPASERRAQLIEVGRSVFAKHGYEGTSVEEIAKRAKVSKPIIYEHFGGKEGLYAVIVDREMDYVEAAKSVGAAIAARALEAGVKVLAFDRSGFRYHGRVKALADAAREAGLKF